MTCTYLLTLDSPPTAPSLNRNLSATERAQLHTEERINELPEDDDTVDLTSPEKPASHHRKPTPDTTDLKAAQLPPSDADGILDVDKGTSPASSPRLGSPPNPERSFIDSLKGVLDLHTARRMKPASDPKSPDAKQKKQRQGVSIPSQRRWLYYWALLLAGDAPKDVLNHTKTPDGKSVTKSAKLSVRVTRIQVRMREGSNVTRRIVHATNVVLHKASSVRKPSSKTSKDRADSTSPTRDTPSPTSKSESTKDDPNQLWASVARYDDDLVDLLEKWEAWTRQEGSGGLAKRRGNSKTMHIDDIEHDLEQLFDSSGKWDSGKMVCSFARFGLRGAKVCRQLS
jgi:phosphatidylinositol-3,4,5-trisphosphate 3-phosphatase/dual-specificity protein phosphatase PTEN